MLHVSDCRCARRAPRSLVASEDSLWFPEALQAAGRRGARSGWPQELAGSLAVPSRQTRAVLTGMLFCLVPGLFRCFRSPNEAVGSVLEDSSEETSAAGAAQDLHRTPARIFRQIPLLHIQDPTLPTEFCFPPDVRLGFGTGMLHIAVVQTCIRYQ